MINSVPSSPDTIAFAATPWGVVWDQKAVVSDPETMQRARAFESHMDGSGVDHVTHDDGLLHFEAEGHDPLEFRGKVLQEGLGGKTLNTWVATRAVLAALAPDHLSRVPLHAIRTPKLEKWLEGLSYVVLENVKDARIRCNHFLLGTEERDTLNLTRPPRPIETGPLPSAPRVFLSSSGPDMEQAVASFDRGRLILAPGKQQTQRGLSTDTLGKVDFLNVNLNEARQLATHLGETGKRTPNELISYFRDLGPREIRITDGRNGVYAGSFGAGDTVLHVGGATQETLKPFVRYGFEKWGTEDRPANTVGCGDARLGAELAAGWVFPEDLHRRLTFANTVAAFQARHGGSHIGVFPPQLIEHIASTVEHKR